MPFVLALMALWTAIVLFSLYMSIRASRKFVVEQAKSEARVTFNKDLAYRRWSVQNGGVYAPVTKNTLPNPYLSDIPERDVRTPSGRLLTLLDHAYMTRQVEEERRDQYGFRGHITGLRAIRPRNLPDSWESGALRSLHRGEREVSSVETIKGEAFLRMMRPFLTEKDCLKCHAKQGYKVGDLHGGISVMVPLAPIRARKRGGIRTGIFLHAGLWLFGLAGIGYGGSKVRKHLDGRERAERKLRESEDRYRDLVDHGKALICTHDLSGKILSANPSAANILGYAPEELLRMNLADILAPEVRGEFEAYLEKIRECGESHGMLLVQTRKGEKRIWEYNNTLRTVGVPEPVVRGVAHDITELKRTEEALRDTTRRLQLAANAGHWGIWEWDVRSDRLLWDGRMFEQYGIPEDAFPAGLEAWGERLHPGDRSVFMADLQSALRGEKEHEVEFRIVQPDGKVRYMESHAIVLRDADGRVTRMIGLNKDITEHRSLKDQLRQSQKMEAVGRLAGGIAHDFNNLMTVVTGYSELLLAQHSPADPERRALEEIGKAGNRATLLTSQLLAFSRKQVLHPKVIDLGEVVSGIEKMLQRLIGEDIVLVTTAGPGLWKVHADPSQVEQVVMNLAVNARDAMPGVGSLSLSLANVTLNESFVRSHEGVNAGQYVALTVRDTGCGMDSQTISRIFEPFFTTKEVGKGTGLGLATVYGIVKQSNGYIDVESVVGAGTTFRVYFPRTAEETAKAGETEASRDSLGGRETILVVEDEKAVRDLVVDVLSGKGYRVLSADEGREGLRLFEERREPVDLLITDLVMPVMGGRELAIRLQDERPGMNVLFMSGYTEGNGIESGGGRPGFRFLQKPFLPNDLLRKVREILDAGRS